MSRRVGVFCGSSSGVATRGYTEAIREVGSALAEAGYGLVYGGGHVGLMGVIADSFLAQGAEVVGVMPTFLVEKEVAHRDIALVQVETMHERKKRMADLAEAFVTLPGGFGTLDEFFEILTWAQLGLHSKPIVLFNVEGFFDPLLALVDHMTTEGFVNAQSRALIVSTSDTRAVIRHLETYKPHRIDKWDRR